MDTLLQDLRYAARTLQQRPGFTLVAILTLMLGIGANTAIFSLVSAVLLRPLPYPGAERLVVVQAARGDTGRLPISVPDFEEWRARNRSFEDLGMERLQSVNLTGAETPDRLIGDFVSAGTLPLLGARTALGRLFTPEETALGGGAPVAVISNAAWKGRFGGDPAMVGRTVVLNGRPHVVIGVLEAGFQDPYVDTEVFLPITSAPSASWLTRDNPQVWGVGRLKPGVSLDAARRDLTAIASDLAREYPATNAGMGAAVLPLRDTLVGSVRPFLLIVLAAVGFVLLIACANVANLQLARAASRGREMSLRAALGAGRSRLVRQVLTENLVLSALGGAAGVLVARWGVRALAAAVPGGLPSYGGVGVDARVLLFSAAITIAAGLLFGAAPALHAARTDLNQSLKLRPAEAEGRGRLDVRSLAVAVELALAIVLLVGAGLLTRSLQELTRVDAGFDPHHVLTAELRLPSNKYATPAAIDQFMDQALGEIRAVPGVRSAALVQCVPLSGNAGSTAYIPDSRPELTPETAPTTQANMVTDGFFKTLAVPLLAGRDFDGDDRADTLPVAIVNQTLAKSAWPGESPIGRRIHVLASPDVWVTVVGVVADLKQLTLGEPAEAQLYAPSAQQPGIFRSVVARTEGEPMALAGQLRAAIWAVDRDQPVWKVRSLDSLVARDVAPPRFTTLLTAGFAALALLLAAVGVYGVMSYAVAQRRREMGIRMALGARQRQLVGLVMGRGLRVVAVATAAGVLAALGASRALAHQLFAVSATDPVAFTLAPALLAAVALLACYLPARRAARVDPAVVLRSE